jgi:dTDP-4-amino-4,6-dideoxygalactose transaminase
MSSLAILGGKKTRVRKFPAYVTIGKAEIKAVNRVIKSGVLSQYLGAWHENFYGGPEVKAFEKEWAEFFQVKHAVAVNSATSALYCAVGASGVGPGDEVIVSPYTMSASATAPIIYGAIPIFADIESDYFCLDPKSIEARITKYTKAIIVVDIFGQPYNAEKINKIAKKHGLTVIEDCAQAPGAKYKDKFAGTLGNIGIFSLNYHKHIHTGEGGVVVTNSDELAEKIRLIRNHAEAVVGSKEVTDLINMVGFNFRMTEIEAAIGREQLKKLPKLLKKRQENVKYLSNQLAKIPCLQPVKVRPHCTHAYYVHSLKFKPEVVNGLHRDKFVEAVKAELPVSKLREKEGVNIGCGYVRPLYLLPMYQKRIAFGGKGYPWSSNFYKGKVNYEKGLCPVTEKMHEEILITHELMRPSLKPSDLDDAFKAFEKVWLNRQELCQR